MKDHEKGRESRKSLRDTTNASNQQQGTFFINHGCRKLTEFDK